MNEKPLHQSIEPRYGEWWVYQWFIPESGVNQGLEQKRHLDDFETKAEARQAYPEAEVYASWCPPQELSPHAPPGYYGSDGGFYDAGEYWSEEDY